MATTKKTAAKKTAAKKTTAKAPAKRGAAKKAVAARTLAKKAPAKKTATRSAANKSRGRKYAPQASEDVREEMHEMKRGELTIGRSDKKVTNPKQAIAIGLAKARREGAKVPPNPNTIALDAGQRLAVTTRPRAPHRPPRRLHGRFADRAPGARGLPRGSPSRCPPAWPKRAARSAGCSSPARSVRA